nr:histidine phosphatase family protein [uncultured Rhodopila sp.]
MSNPPLTVHPVAFWFLRHGETDWNAQDFAQGSVDVPLNQTGLAQARSAGLLLRERGIRSLISSPLSRAKATADIVAAQLGLPVQVDDALREVAFGVQEGKPMTAWFSAWVEGQFTPDGGESFAALTQRAVGVINRCIQRPPVVLVVGHGGVFRALRGAMGHAPNVRTRNGVPVWCEPPAAAGKAWGITYVD